MTVRKIEIGCDVPDCWAHYSVTAQTVEDAREQAAERWGWTYGDDSDVCGPCSRGDTPQARGESR